MANITVSVTDANNITVQLTPVAAQNITIDRGVAGNGIVSIVPVTITTLQYLRITYTNGTVQDVGPLTSTAYTGDSPITIVGNTISLATVPISKGGTNAITAAAAIQNLLPSYTGNGSKRLGLNSGATALEWVADGGGTVTSVDVSGGTTGLITSGGPITGSGTITLTGTLATTNGGTGLTAFTANGLVYASSTSALATGSALTFNGTSLAVTSSNTPIIGSVTTAGNNVFSATSADFSAILHPLYRFSRFGAAVTGAIGYDGINTATYIYNDGNFPLYLGVSNTKIAEISSTGLTVGGSATEKLSSNGALRVSGAVTASATGTVVSYQGSSLGLLGVWGANSSTIGQLQFNLTDSTGSLGGERMRLSSTGLAVTGTLSSSGDATVGSAGGTRTLTIGNTSSTGAGFINFVTSSAFKNWQIASNQYVGSALSFTPSTATGGTTFTTPILNILDTGVAVTGALSATTSITSIGSVGNVSTDSTGARLNFSRGADNYFQASTAGGYFAWVVNGSGSNAMTLDASGNLGIGTTSPTQKLQVAGKIAVSGTNPSIQQTVQNAFLDLCGGTTVGTDPSIQIAGSTTVSDANKIFYNSNAHVFRSTSGGTTYATIDTSGNLGLGVTPSAWSASFRAMQIGSGAAFWAPTSGGIPYAYMSANQVYDTGNTSRYINNGFASWYIQQAGTHIWATAPSGTAGNAITFTQAMYLDASGNLGVGTTSPASFGAFAVRKATSVGGVNVSGQFSDAANSTFDIRHPAANIVNLSAQGSSLTFDAGAAERMRLDSSGNLLVGTTSQILSNTKFNFSSSQGVALGGMGFVNTVAPSIKWQIGPDSAGNFVIFNGSAVGVYVANGGTAWTAYSDERLKTTLIPFKDAAAKVATLRAGTGRYLKDAEGTSRSFLIAQDVQKVLPEAVDTNNPDVLGLSYTDVIPLLVAAIQEQSAIITTLATRITALERA